MTRTLVLMRHAQASYHADSDFDRPLDEYGCHQAEQAGLLLAGYELTYALVSAAARTRETFEKLQLGIPAEFHKNLYLGGVDTIVTAIGEVEDSQSGLIVIGHAPDIPQLATEISYWASSSDAERRAADRAQCRFATADYACFSLDCTWAELAEDLKELRPLPKVKKLGGSAFTS